MQQDPKNRQNFSTWARSHNFVGLYLLKWGTYRQSEKNVKHQCLSHMSSVTMWWPSAHSG